MAKQTKQTLTKCTDENVLRVAVVADVVKESDAQTVILAEKCDDGGCGIFKGYV